MGRAKLQRVEYPAERELQFSTPTTNTPSPNFYSLDHDQRAWVAPGKSFSLYRNERTYFEPQKPASATDFYNTDQSAKMSLSHKVQRSPYRYVAMRAHSAGRDHDRAYLGTFISTPERVGPGLYNENLRVGVSMPRISPNSSAFASGVVRGSTLKRQFAEPGYATLALDNKTWTRHANLITKGHTFPQLQRWQRPPGPGSNRPSEKATPGPGSYGKLHAWPDEGFKGSSRGFNLNRSVG